MAKADFAQVFIRANDQTKGAFDSAARNMRGLQSDAAKLNQFVGRLGVTLGGAFTVRSIGQAADDFSNLQSRLKLASRSLEEFNAANSAVTRIAAAAQAPLLETATLYVRIASSLKDTSVSQAEMVDTTEAVALALRISGASSVEAASTMLQFSQAIASGVLRGEEFNAVSEAAPRLLQALSASLGVGTGDLRAMAKAGELTREVLIDGLARQLPTLQKEAESLPRTIGASMTNLKNQFLLTIGQIDQATGASAEFAKTLQQIGGPAITTAFQAIAVFGANVAFVFKGVGREIAGVAAQAVALARLDFKGAKFIGQAVTEDGKKARAELDALEKRLLQVGGKSAALAPSTVKPKSRYTERPDAKDNKPKTVRGSKSDPQGAFVDRLRQEAGTLGLGAEALLRYEAAKLKLTGTNAKLAGSFISQITAFKEQQAAAKASNEEFDEFARKQEESEAAVEGAIKSLREYAAEQQFEASLLGLTNVERETAIQLRAAETAGVDTQTESFRRLAEQVKAASGDRRLASLISDTDVAKTKEFLSDVDLITNAFFDGKIGSEQMAQGIDKITVSAEKASEEVDQFAKKAAENFQSALADFLFDPFKDGLDGMLQQFGNFVKRAGAEAIAADLTKALFGDTSKSGGGEGLLGGLFKSSGSSGSGGTSWISSLASLFGFAKGGVMSGHGPIALSAYAGGGIASRPQLALFGEGSQNEAFVPLPDGKRIPVAMNGGGGSTINITLNGTNNAPDVRRAGGQVAREISGLLSGAQRYA